MKGCFEGVQVRLKWSKLRTSQDYSINLESLICFQIHNQVTVKFLKERQQVTLYAFDEIE